MGDVFLVNLLTVEETRIKLMPGGSAMGEDSYVQLRSFTPGRTFCNHIIRLSPSFLKETIVIKEGPNTMQYSATNLAMVVVTTSVRVLFYEFTSTEF
jgi:hypothetical protein